MVPRTGAGHRNGCGEPAFRLRYPVHGILVFGLQALAAAIGKDIRDNVDPVAQVIKGQDGGEIHEVDVIEPQFVRGAGRKLLELPYQVIGKITHSASQKRRQPLQVDGAEPPGDLPELNQRPPLFRSGFSQFLRHDSLSLRAHNQKGIPAYEGITRQPLAPFDALQEKNAGAPLSDTEERGSRREQIPQDVLVQRDHVPLACQVLDRLKRRLDHSLGSGSGTASGVQRFPFLCPDPALCPNKSKKP